MTIVNDAISASTPGTAKQFLGSVQPKPLVSMIIYIGLLSLFGLIGTVIGLTMFVGPLGGFFPMEWVIISAVFTVISTIAAFVGGSMIFSAMSQSIIGRQVSTEEVLTVAGLAATPGLVAGIFNIIPGIGLIVMLLAGLYSLYLLFLGFSARYADKAIVALIVFIVLAGVAGYIVSIILGIILLAVYNPFAGLGGLGRYY